MASRALLAMATRFDKTKRVLNAIMKHHMEKYRLDAGSPIEKKTFLDAAFLGKLVQLARPIPEARRWSAVRTPIRRLSRAGGNA